MPTIDLGPPRPGPRDLLDGLPRRVSLTLPELRYAAEAAGGAPLPFDLVDLVDRAGGGDSVLAARLGGAVDADDAAAYAAALARLAAPVDTLTRRGLLVAGELDRGILGAVGLLATPRFALDLDVVAGGVQARCWHRQSAGAVASLATADGLVFELAWFPTWAWADELSRVAVIPEDLPLTESRVPGFVDLPHELADAGVEAVRSHRADLLPVLAAQHRGRVTDETGDVLTDLEVGTVLTALASEPQGRLRAMVADVSGAAAATVGVVAWTLVGDGWRALRPHGVDERLHVEVRRVIPEDLAADLAPVLAVVTGARPPGPRG
ncbi:hypothetical protein [Nocardioides sp.]|uniref:hypothetical protein n=1 Tax=Nocardioides sp. TaxID=35761 RepID=UPI001A1D6429|nr:hypothetical protein [Nocardioides sp.]MBJ7358015.1 hypothetical protein [Nocardioides sp.]